MVFSWQRACFQSEGQFSLAWELDVTRKKQETLMSRTKPFRTVGVRVDLTHEPPDGNRKSVPVGSNLPFPQPIVFPSTCTTFSILMSYIKFSARSRASLWYPMMRIETGRWNSGQVSLESDVSFTWAHARVVPRGTVARVIVRSCFYFQFLNSGFRSTVSCRFAEHKRKRDFTLQHFMWHLSKEETHEFTHVEHICIFPGQRCFYFM